MNSSTAVRKNLFDISTNKLSRVDVRQKHWIVANKMHNLLMDTMAKYRDVLAIMPQKRVSVL